MKKDLSKNVIPTLDSNYASNEDFLKAEILNLEIKDEIIPEEAPKCFLGAWYRKVYSSFDYWLGIEGEITLGEFTSDKERLGFDNRVDYKRDLDSPSIYIGGKSFSESDAGLGFMSGYLNKDDSFELNYGSPKIAYRPFYRYIYSKVTDKEGNVERINVNSWNVSNPRDFDFYYFPGDKLKMSIYSPLENYLQLRIELLEETNILKYKTIREGFKLKRKPRVYLSSFFYSEGHGKNKAEFKRVNSIDQYGNEGFIVKETKASVSKAIWENTYLYRKVNNTIYKVAFNKKRQTEMSCPNKESFVINSDNFKEEITIKPKTFKKD